MDEKVLRHAARDALLHGAASNVDVTPSPDAGSAAAASRSRGEEPVAWRWKDSALDPWSYEPWDYMSASAQAELHRKHAYVESLYSEAQVGALEKDNFSLAAHQCTKGVAMPNGDFRCCCLIENDSSDLRSREAEAITMLEASGLWYAFSKGRESIHEPLYACVLQEPEIDGEEGCFPFESNDPVDCVTLALEGSGLDLPMPVPKPAAAAEKP